MYALSTPAISGGAVTQGHTDYCGANGHATYTVAGVDQGMCPRCGEVTATKSYTTDSALVALQDNLPYDSVVCREDGTTAVVVGHRAVTVFDTRDGVMVTVNHIDTYCEPIGPAVAVVEGGTVGAMLTTIQAALRN